MHYVIEEHSHPERLYAPLHPTPVYLAPSRLGFSLLHICISEMCRQDFEGTTSKIVLDTFYKRYIQYIPLYMQFIYSTVPKQSQNFD